MSYFFSTQDIYFNKNFSSFYLFFENRYFKLIFCYSFVSLLFVMHQKYFLNWFLCLMDYQYTQLNLINQNFVLLYELFYLINQYPKSLNNLQVVKYQNQLFLKSFWNFVHYLSLEVYVISFHSWNHLIFTEMDRILLLLVSINQFIRQHQKNVPLVLHFLSNSC